jgi:hypothetical protein
MPSSVLSGITSSPYANDGQMETQASSLMRAQLVYIGQRMRKVSYKVRI